MEAAAADVLFPYHAPPGVARPMRPSTTGLASGNTVLEAAAHGICEIVERWAVSRFVVRGGAPLVDLATVDADTAALIARFERAGVAIAAFDLSNEGALPTYFVTTVAADTIGSPLVAAGQGTSLSHASALRRALLEAAQARVVGIQGSREDLVRHAAQWAATETEARDAWRAQRDAAAAVGLVPVPEPSAPPRSLVEAVAAMLDRLGTDTNVYVTDLTHPSIEIPVVHVSIAGHFDWIVDPQRGRA
jgi:ribosomal protein S12 methylthiotransferase accessory factor